MHNTTLNILAAKWRHFSYRLKSRKRKFTEIYSKHGFSGHRFPPSGAGSTLEQTAKIRQLIPDILRELNAGSLLDAPCGDFTWMREIDLGNTSYTGADIVEELIDMNTRAYSGEKTAFIVADIVKDDLPKADVVLCRDCFVHLSNKDIVRAVKNIKESQSTYLLTTTFYEMRENRDLVSGRGWRPINLNIPPFNLPPALKMIVEECTEFDGTYYDKSLGLWRLFDLDL